MVTGNTLRVISTMALAFLVVMPARALAHCDGLDGPVVKAAQRALETRNPALVLMWVQEKDAPEIVTAFAHTLAVRELSPQAKELADRFFFETSGGRRRSVHRPQTGRPRSRAGHSCCGRIHSRRLRGPHPPVADGHCSRATA
jgi:hypothetical protein